MDVHRVWQNMMEIFIDFASVGVMIKLQERLQIMWKKIEKTHSRLNIENNLKDRQDMAI